MPFHDVPILNSEYLDPGDPRYSYPQRVAVSQNGMAATAHFLATEAAVEIMQQGGNAIDGAIAAAFALGVVEPAASGLGGQTMIMMYDSKQKKKIALDGSSRAPNRIIPGKMKRSDLLHGHSATTVPSTPAVLGYALKHYGTKTLAQVLEPAIRLAEVGYRITPLQHYLCKREVKHLRANTAGSLFLSQGRIYAIGTTIRQEKLAQTLKQLAKEGVEDFYQGKIARTIHDDMVANQGLIREDDLAQIPWPIERRPLSTTFRDKRLFTVGPPGAGRTLIEAANLLSQFTPQQANPETPKGALLLAHIIRKANLDRSDRPADPALFAQELELGMDITHQEYARKISKRIRNQIQTSGETTHLSVMDGEGNMVGLTQSIERVFGSFAASPELGFLYNNYMSAFEYEDITHPFYLRPNANPWASVAPTLVFRGRQPWMVLGSPGSERIVSAILQVLLRIDQGFAPHIAIEAPRMHCSMKGRVSLEASRMRNDIPELLKKRGFEIDIRDPYSFYLGCVQLVMQNKKGKLIGAADPRRDGSAGGV